MPKPVTLSDLNNRGVQQANQYRVRGNRAQAQRAQGMNTGGLFGGLDGEQTKLPREETYCDMWTTTFCPNFTCCSFTAMLVLLQTVLFITGLVYSNMLESGMCDYYFLGTSKETLMNMGLRMPYRIYHNYEVWRLLTSALLSYNLQSFAITVIIEMIIGFMLEAAFGSFRMLLFMLITVAGANIFASAMTYQYAVGPEAIVYGMFAGLIAMFIVYWDKLGENTSRKICLLFIVVLLMVLSIMILQRPSKVGKAFASALFLSYPDIPACLGGCMFGLFTAFMLLPTHVKDGDDPEEKKRAKCLQIIGLCMILFLGTLFTFLFFS